MRQIFASQLVIVCLFAVPIASAQDDGPKSTPEQRLMFARSAARDYRFRLNGKPGQNQVTLQPAPLLRWDNQVIREDDGMLFLWTAGDKGRPVAAAQFFVVESSWHHEFQSLSLTGFDARNAGAGAENWAWQPTRPGLELLRADGIDTVADSAGQRLRQMKTIAERFTAAVDPDGKFDNPEQLRLLTTPVYRYTAPDQGISDGALFAFVQGTNPEILIVIEAFGAEPETRFWRYGFARMSCFFLRVQRDDRIVWKTERAPVPTPDREGTYFFRLNAQVDRSSELDIPAARSKAD
jgi:hypothetical protein